MTELLWHARYMKLAVEVRSWTKGGDTGVGAVLVDPYRRRLSTGYSGLPRGIADTDERLQDSSVKDSFGVHAELNAILNAGTSVVGWTMYTTRFPCSHCAAAIIQAGVSRLVSPGLDTDGRWRRSQVIGLSILNEAGVRVVSL